MSEAQETSRDELLKSKFGIKRKGTQWYTAEDDNYDIVEKLKKEGCRQLKRELLECQSLKANCQEESNHFEECMTFLKHFRLQWSF